MTENNPVEEQINEYTKEMTDLNVPGDWHYQMFGGEEDEFYYVVILFNPQDEVFGIIGEGETPYKAWIDAELEVQNGDYPFTWDELSAKTGAHTAAWEELEQD